MDSVFQKYTGAFPFLKFPSRIIYFPERICVHGPKGLAKFRQSIPHKNTSLCIAMLEANEKFYLLLITYFNHCFTVLNGRSHRLLTENMNPPLGGHLC